MVILPAVLEGRVCKAQTFAPHVVFMVFVAVALRGERVKNVQTSLGVVIQITSKVVMEIKAVSNILGIQQELWLMVEAEVEVMSVAMVDTFNQLQAVEAVASLFKMIVTR